MLQKRVVTPACWRLYDGTWQLLYILQKGAESPAVLAPTPNPSGPPPHPQLQRKDSLVGQAHFLMDVKSSGGDAPEAIVDTSMQCHQDFIQHPCFLHDMKPCVLDIGSLEAISLELSVSTDLVDKGTLSSATWGPDHFTHVQLSGMQSTVMGRGQQATRFAAPADMNGMFKLSCSSLCLRESSGS